MFCVIELNCSYPPKEQLYSWRAETRPFPYNAAVFLEANLSITIAMAVKLERDTPVVVNQHSAANLHGTAGFKPAEPLTPI